MDVVPEVREKWATRSRAAQPVQIDPEARAAMLWKEMCAARGNVSIEGKITYSVILLACGQNGTGR